MACRIRSRHKKTANFPAVCCVRVSEMRKIPAVTSDEDCTNADRGVGTAIAAGSHLEYGIWALLVIAATRTPNCEFRKSKMADGRHFEIINPILMKFNAQERILIKMAVIHFTKIQNFSNSRQRTSAIFKIVFWR